MHHFWRVIQRKAVATANAWYTEVEQQIAGVVHGLSCMPEYQSMGFVPMKTATYSEVDNEYDAALRVMEGKMREDKYRQFIELAE